MMLKAYEFELHIYQKLDFYSCNTCAVILIIVNLGSLAYFFK